MRAVGECHSQHCALRKHQSDHDSRGTESRAEASGADGDEFLRRGDGVDDAPMDDALRQWRRGRARDDAQEHRGPRPPRHHPKCCHLLLCSSYTSSYGTTAPASSLSPSPMTSCHLLHLPLGSSPSSHGAAFIARFLLLLPWRRHRHLVVATLYLVRHGATGFVWSWQRGREGGDQAGEMSGKRKGSKRG